MDPYAPASPALLPESNSGDRQPNDREMPLPDEAAHLREFLHISLLVAGSPRRT